MLTDLQARKLTVPGKYADGGGLYLVIDGKGRRRWVFMWKEDGRRTEMGLGSANDVKLTEAREAGANARRLLREGKNPLVERRAEEQRRREEAEREKIESITFGEWAEKIAPDIGPKAPKALKAWVSMMKEKVGPLANMRLKDIGTDDVLAALKPYWISRPESGSRMRQRIEKTLDAARAKKLISGLWENPARHKGHLELLLSERQTPVKHYPALPYEQAPAFWSQLRSIEYDDRLAAIATAWTIMNVVRVKQTRLAQAKEIDFENKQWVIPADHMKGKAANRREHIVPLTDEAIELLRQAEPEGGWEPDDLLFESARSRTGVYSENAFQNVIVEMGFKGKATVHGWRSTFKDWCADCTNFSDELSEQVLSHIKGDSTWQAYRRRDALAKRRKVMEAWSGYLTASNVIPMSRRRA